MEDKLKILTIPHKILTQKTKKVKVFDDRLKNLIKEMRITQESVAGIGLAAPQVGYPLQLAVIEYVPPKDKDAKERKEIPLTILINPKIIRHSRTIEVKDEGCLSIPGIELPVARFQSIAIKTQEENGDWREIKAKGLLARIIQHEIDHLNGMLITDRTIKKEGEDD